MKCIIGFQFYGQGNMPDDMVDTFPVLLSGMGAL